MNAVRKIIVPGAYMAVFASMLLTAVWDIRIPWLLPWGLGIVLLDRAVDEWLVYWETKHKRHLLIPAVFVAAAALVLFSLLSGRTF